MKAEYSKTNIWPLPRVFPQLIANWKSQLLFLPHKYLFSLSHRLSSHCQCFDANHRRSSPGLMKQIPELSPCHLSSKWLPKCLVLESDFIMPLPSPFSHAHPIPSCLKLFHVFPFLMKVQKSLHGTQGDLSFLLSPSDSRPQIPRRVMWDLHALPKVAYSALPTLSHTSAYVLSFT